MTRRSLFLTIAAALVVAGIGALDARAGSVALPQPYSTLLIPGTYTTVVARRHSRSPASLTLRRLESSRRPSPLFPTPSAPKPAYSLAPVSSTRRQARSRI